MKENLPQYSTPIFIYKKHLQFQKAFFLKQILLNAFKKPFLLFKVLYFSNLEGKFGKVMEAKSDKKPLGLLNENKNPFLPLIYCFLGSEKGFSS